MGPDASITRFDPTSSMSALDAIFDAISAFRKTDGEELSRLDRYVDGDAINLLFGDPNSSTTSIEEGTLSFRYDDMFVTVTHDGWIWLVDADAYHTQPASYGISANAHAQQSTEVALEVAEAALVEAEEHVWIAASNTPDDELVDPLWAIVERLWNIQTRISDVTSQSSSTDSQATGTDNQS